MGRIRFSLDKIFDYNSVDFDYGDVPAGFIDKVRRRKEEAMRAMVKFVQEHARLFKRRLKTADCFDPYEKPIPRQNCPVEIQLQVARVLPPLYQPTTLENFNWIQLLPRPKSTDLGHVKEIVTRKIPGAWVDMVISHRQFLQRCRALKRINMESLGQGSFKWAVQEKAHMVSLGKDSNLNNSCSGSGLLYNDGSRLAHLGYGLVPLAEVEIRERRTPFTDEIDDIAFAFSSTLTSFRALTSQGLSELLRNIHVGRGWIDLLLLTILDLDLFTCTNNTRLVIGRQLLEHCPNLVNARLLDSTKEYRCQDVVPYLPAHLSVLQTLRMTGWSALAFHPATLSGMAHASSVEELDRSYGVHDATMHVPSTPEIIRPRWTCDWELPWLDDLCLTAVFAYRFEFRMLRGCPSLRILKLFMTTADGLHRRVLSVDDLLFSNINSDDPSTPPEKTVAPALRYFDLKTAG
ncbi:hypothetical protein BGX33_001602 [Mortierella sp. NVP41]|nr:hypothetical protein BGX33_001602 [Mortierella sp. NVP41]